MSDYSQGEGWWLASDGKWYPPEAAVPPVDPAQPFGAPPGPPPGGPPPVGMPAVAPGKSRLGTGPIVAIVVAAVLIIGAIVFFATSGGDDKKDTAATSSSSSSSITTPAGFSVFTDDKDGFAVAVPTTLEIADLSSGDVEGSIAAAEAQNSAFSEFSAQIRSLMGNRGKMFAVDLSEDGFADNLSVIKAPAFDTTSASGKAALQRQIESFGGANIVTTEETVDGRKVLKSVYDVTSGQRHAFGGQAYVPDGDTVWILTLTSSSPAGADFDTIVSSVDVS